MPKAVTATSEDETAFMIGMPVASISAGTIRNPPPMPKKPDSEPVASPRPTMAGRFDMFILTSAAPTRARVFSISMRDHQHHQREQRQQLVPVQHLAEDRTEEGAEDAGGRERQRAGPHDSAAAGMIGEIDRRIGGDRDRAGADRDMRFGNADHIDHQRHRQDRAAAADEAERKSDQRSRYQSEQALRGRDDQIEGLTFTVSL